MTPCATQPRLDAYHDDELPPADRADIEAHLRQCQSCGDELAAIRAMSGAFAKATPVEASDQRLRQWAQGVRTDRAAAAMLFRLFRWTAIAAAAVLASAIATELYLSHQARAAAHQALVLDHDVAWPQSSDPSGNPIGEETDQQVRLANWIARDLAGARREAP